MVYRNYLVKERKGTFSVFPPHSDWVAEVAGLPDEAAAKRYIDNRLLEIASSNAREADKDGYTD